MLQKMLVEGLSNLIFLLGKYQAYSLKGTDSCDYVRSKSQQIIYQE